MYNNTEHDRSTQLLPKFYVDGLTTSHITNTSDVHQNYETNHKKNHKMAIDVAINECKEKIYRPTYGAYLQNSLPRGPYLQYKFNDQKPTQTLEQHQKDNDNNRIFLKHKSEETMKTADGNFNTLPHLKRLTLKQQNMKCDMKANYGGNMMLKNWPNSEFSSSNGKGNMTIIQGYHQTISSKQKANETEHDLQKGFIERPEINSDPSHNKNTNLSKEKDFLKQIHERNSHILARMTTCNLRDTRSIGHSLPTSLNSNEYTEFERNTIQVNFVTLAEVIQAKPEKLNEIEGWAVLCQAVQALQDMFLADFPPTSKILPLVRTSTIQITSRGRVVFSVTTLSQLDKFNDATSYFDVMDHLSPEYLSNMGKKVVFAESDMEKMWIYSLGTALRKAIKYSYNTQGLSGTGFNKGTTEKYCFHSLHQVIECMCEKNLQKRASLMYLLDVISLFCRSQKQVKPFSHIVMEIFQLVTQLSTVEEECTDYTAVIAAPETNQIADGGVKSGTDSGRSSAYGDRDPTPPCLDARKSCLKVKRSKALQEVKYDYCGTIGYAGIKSLQTQKAASDKPNQLQVVRRNRKDILKRRNDFRRNTIDVSLFDIEKAKQTKFVSKMNTTRSMEGINKCVMSETKDFNTKIDKMQFIDETSLPDLCPPISENVKIVNLKAKPSRVYNKDILSKAYSEESFLTKPKGPEFIPKSKFASKELCITNSKCQHQKTMNVLLLNGQTVKITCNSVTTTTHQILEAVVQTENYVENFFLGLCALIGGDFVFLPKDLKIYKVAPQIWINPPKKGQPRIEDPNFTLFVRIKFFLPTLRGISSLESRHMLYLQLRKSILERHILCTDDDLISLGGLALQAEMGDFKQSMKYHGEYFTISHYLPEGVYHSNKEMAKYLRNSHFCRRGLHPKEAEQNFIKYIQEMKEYGFHLYSAIWTTDDGSCIDVYVGISLGGMTLFERNNKLTTATNTAATAVTATTAIAPGTNSKMSYQRKLYMSFEWLEIENLCYSKHILCIVVRKSESLKAKDNNRIKYKLKMDGRKSYFAFSLASEHHQFYMKLRNSFISLKNLSAELNIPITSRTFEDKKSEIGSSNQATSISSLSSSSSPSIPFSLGKTTMTAAAVAVAGGAVMEKVTKATTTAKTTLTSNKNDGNTNLEQSQSHLPEGTLPENIKKIDKQLKASGLRVRNLKKSMLNDNRLTKLKERFLKRSKSTAGAIVGKVTTTMHKETKDGKNVKKLRDERMNDDNKEENQNKENECPIKGFVDGGDESLKVVYSPNRNRVKMGTRVFSSQFLNKSFDNIYEHGALNICQFESTSSIDKEPLDENGVGFTFSGGGGGIDSQSLNSASHQSLYFTEKLLSNSKLYDSIPPSTEAFVIHSSIKSDRDLHHNFTLPNETVSESLLEKFTNISCSNNERILTKLTVVKERLHSVVDGTGDLRIRSNETKRDPIKYATFSHRMVKEYHERNGITCEKDKYGINRNGICNRKYSSSMGLWLPTSSRSQESIFIDNKFPTENNIREERIGGVMAINHENMENDLDGFTLGISIVQGSDNNVYVKDLVKNGPGDKAGIQIGDQIIAVNGISLLNLSYDEALKKLQNTGLVVELIVSQVLNRTSDIPTASNLTHNNSFVASGNQKDLKLIKRTSSGIINNIPSIATAKTTPTPSLPALPPLSPPPSTTAPTAQDVYLKQIRFATDDICHANSNETKEIQSKRNGVIMPAKSMPDLPKVVAIIPKRVIKTGDRSKIALPRTVGNSRKYVGPVRYPVTPFKTILSPMKQQLSLLADSDDDQVYI